MRSFVNKITINETVTKFQKEILRMKSFGQNFGWWTRGKIEVSLPQNKALVAKLKDRNTILFIPLPHKSLTNLLCHGVDKALQTTGMEETKKTLRFQVKYPRCFDRITIRAKCSHTTFGIFIAKRCFT